MNNLVATPTAASRRTGRPRAGGERSHRPARAAGRRRSASRSRRTEPVSSAPTSPAARSQPAKDPSRPPHSHARRSRCSGPSGTTKSQPLLDASVAQARLSGDSGPTGAVGLAARGWLALRSGDLVEPRAMRAQPSPQPCYRPPPMYPRAERRRARAGAPAARRARRGRPCAHALAAEIESQSLTATVLLFSRGKQRVERGQVADGLDDFLTVGGRLTRALVHSIRAIPVALGGGARPPGAGRSRVGSRLAAEELELAEAFGAPRALGVARRAAGIVAGGERGELLLRNAVDAFEQRRLQRSSGRERRRTRRDAAAAEPANGGPRPAPRGTRRLSPRRGEGAGSQRRPRRNSAPRVRGHVVSCSSGSTSRQRASAGSQTSASQGRRTGRSPRRCSSPRERSRVT